MPKQIVAIAILLILAGQVAGAYAWSNGGFSTDMSHPDYGTHDWIAQHALDWLPLQKKQYIIDNLQVYLYGTELPDNGQAAGGIGDTGLHHIYYSSSGVLQDDAAAIRAEQEYQKALDLIKAGNLVEAAKHAGAMTHYISDVAVFGHVMGKTTDWGIEVHHSDYEEYVNDLTSAYSKTYIKQLQFDGSLATTSARDAANLIALDTTLDRGGTYTAHWMDLNYNWISGEFTQRSWASIDLAVNEVADVLSTLYNDFSVTAQQPVTITCLVSENKVTVNHQITIFGQISADVSATILVQNLVNDTWINVATAITVHGVYTTQISLPEGSHLIRSSWMGDLNHEAATSQLQSLEVIPLTGSIRINVTDENGSPIVSALITSIILPVSQSNIKATTDSTGTCFILEARLGSYTFNVSKNGFNVKTVSVFVSEGQTTILKIALSDKNTNLPAYPISAILFVFIVIMGYFIVFRIKTKY